MVDWSAQASPGDRAPFRRRRTRRVAGVERAQKQKQLDSLLAASSPKWLARTRSCSFTPPSSSSLESAYTHCALAARIDYAPCRCRVVWQSPARMLTLSTPGSAPTSDLASGDWLCTSSYGGMRHARLREAKSKVYELHAGRLELCTKVLLERTSQRRFAVAYDTSRQYPPGDQHHFGVQRARYPFVRAQDTDVHPVRVPGTAQERVARVPPAAVAWCARNSSGTPRTQTFSDGAGSARAQLSSTFDFTPIRL
ncbi:hypothetical protein C8Q77DRAFT_732630 [Trametes polyzona]|nr:hypothetical protein C8Q77DRAFT_732630 [Trametes polyzona]